MRDRKRWAAVLALLTALVVGVAASACTTEATSQTEPGDIANCPQAGKWAISVWQGENSTETGQALATCAEAAIAAAYYIDPQTQVWWRWFAGRPEISNLLTLDGGQGVLALGGGASASTAANAELRAAALEGMLGCPEPGKWAISVWSGATGTATGDALAGCTGASVVAAYWIDPQTQEWQRYFDGRPNISTLTTLDEMQGIMTLRAGPEPTPTPTQGLPLTPTAAPSTPTPTAGPSTPTPTPSPGAGLQLILVTPGSVHVGDTVRLSVRLEGDAVAFAAFNFDLMYDQTLVSLGAPEPALDGLNTADRTFQCDLPPPSGDADPDPQVGRARLVCFSFGGAQASAPSSPMTIATVDLTGVQTGTAEIRFENAAFFAPDASPIVVAPQPGTILIE